MINFFVGTGIGTFLGVTSVVAWALCAIQKQDNITQNVETQTAEEEKKDTGD